MWSSRANAHAYAGTGIIRPCCSYGLPGRPRLTPGKAVLTPAMAHERQTGNRNISSKKAHISAQDRASALAS